MKKSPSGFRSKGQGIDRKVHPVFEPTGIKAPEGKATDEGRETIQKSQIKNLTGDTPLKKPKSFTVNFKYSEKPGDGETVVVISNSYRKALDEAFEEKVDKRRPIEIEVIDPDLGRVLRVIGSGIKKVASIGGKYAVKGGHIAKRASIAGVRLAGKQIAITGKKAGQQIAAKYRDASLKSLVNKSYSEDKGERALARAKLKSEFPDVYDVCDFSKS